MKYVRYVWAVLAIIFTFSVAVYLIKEFIASKEGTSVNDNEAASNRSRTSKAQFAGGYPLHKDITVSVFWVGEQADNANDFISNRASAWDINWMEHFGGEDAPGNRNGYLPSGFTPKENTFYFALPYNDLDQDGNRKPQALDLVYWSGDKNWTAQESMLKNQWIKVSKDGLSAYAQWEDVGPFEENDGGYVFGKDSPSNDKKSAAGLDVSPAVEDYLKLSGIDTVNWQFVRESDVPEGPWKQTITTRNGN